MENELFTKQEGPEELFAIENAYCNDFADIMMNDKKIQEEIEFLTNSRFSYFLRKTINKIKNSILSLVAIFI